MTVKVHFSRPRDEAEGPTLGPFPWVQITYTELRVGPDGETLAMLDAGDWHLAVRSGGSAWKEIGPDLAAEPWSDIVIYPAF